MVCPKCGGKVTVSDTMHGFDNDTYRRRKCLECGYLFHTIETIEKFCGDFRLKFSAAQQIKNHGYGQTK